MFICGNGGDDLWVGFIVVLAYATRTHTGKDIKAKLLIKLIMAMM